MARPTALTPEVQAVVVAAIERGHYRAIAAQLAGIARRTLNNWEERGEAGEAPYAAFLHAIKKAEAIAEDKLLTGLLSPSEPEVTDHGSTIEVKSKEPIPWQVRAWVMERRWPSRWGGRIRATVDSELAAVLKRIEAKLDPETFAKVIDATREDAAGEDAAGTTH